MATTFSTDERIQRYAKALSREDKIQLLRGVGAIYTANLDPHAKRGIQFLVVVNLASDRDPEVAVEVIRQLQHFDSLEDTTNRLHDKAVGALISLCGNRDFFVFKDTVKLAHTVGPRTSPENRSKLLAAMIQTSTKATPKRREDFEDEIGKYLRQLFVAKTPFSLIDQKNLFDRYRQVLIDATKMENPFIAKKACFHIDSYVHSSPEFIDEYMESFAQVLGIHPPTPGSPEALVSVEVADAVREGIAHDARFLGLAIARLRNVDHEQFVALTTTFEEICFELAKDLGTSRPDYSRKKFAYNLVSLNEVLPECSDRWDKIELSLWRSGLTHVHSAIKDGTVVRDEFMQTMGIPPRNFAGQTDASRRI